MTELERQIDLEVGNDTEHTRLAFLKYVNYGKRLQLEASDSVLKSEMDEALKAQAREILDAVAEVLAKANADAERVEREDEDIPFEEMKQEASHGPIKAEMIERFDVLLRTVDARHSAIFKERAAAIAAIRAKYIGEE